MHMQIQKLKYGQQNNDEGSFNLNGANKKASLKCKKIIIKTLAKLYESVYCHSLVICYINFISCVFMLAFLVKIVHLNFVFY